MVTKRDDNDVCVFAHLWSRRVCIAFSKIATRHGIASVLTYVKMPVNTCMHLLQQVWDNHCDVRNHRGEVAAARARVGIIIPRVFVEAVVDAEKAEEDERDKATAKRVGGPRAGERGSKGPRQVSSRQATGPPPRQILALVRNITADRGLLLHARAGATARAESGFPVGPLGRQRTPIRPQRSCSRPR